MIEGYSALLSPDQQAVIGGWITKTALLGAFSVSDEDNPNGEIMREILLNMMDHGMPPVTSTSVRIARRDPAWRADAQPTNDLSAYLPASLPQPLACGVTAFGYLAFEAVVGVEDDIVEFIADTQDREWFIRAWPPGRSDRTWPPPRVMTQSDLLGLIDAWTRATPIEDRRPGLFFEWTPSP